MNCSSIFSSSINKIIREITIFERIEICQNITWRRILDKNKFCFSSAFVFIERIIGEVAICERVGIEWYSIFIWRRIMDINDSSFFSIIIWEKRIRESVVLNVWNWNCSPRIILKIAILYMKRKGAIYMNGTRTGI